MGNRSVGVKGSDSSVDRIFNKSKTYTVSLHENGKEVWRYGGLDKRDTEKVTRGWRTGKMAKPVPGKYLSSEDWW